MKGTGESIGPSVVEDFSQKKSMAVERNMAALHIPTSRRIAWGCGGAADNILYNGMNSLVLPIFNVGMGINVVKLGYVIGFPRLFDAITDTIIGNVSDNSHSTWGRRRPFIFCGIVLSALFLGLLFSTPRGWSENAMLTYIFLTGSLFYIAYAIFVIPYSALGFELTTDYYERTRVLAWRMYLGLMAGLAVPWFYKLSFVINHDEVVGAKTVAWIMAAVVLALGLVPAVFVPETKKQPRREPMHFFRSLKVTFQNRSFLLLTGSTLLILLGLFLAGPLGVYINIYYIYHGEKESAASMLGWATTFGMSSGLLGLPVATWLGRRLSKRNAAVGLLALVFLSILTTWWFFTPTNPWLQMIPTFVLYFCINGAFLLGSSMLADICDEDELVTGLRREGIYSAASEFSKKCAIAFSTIISGYVLAASGFDAKIHVQTEQTVMNLRIGYIVVLGMTLCGGIILLSFFPITHARAIETRRLLDARRRLRESPDPLA